MKKNIKNESQIPLIKKDLKAFLTSEEGKITNKNILKLGLGLIMVFRAIQHDIAKGAQSPEFKNNSFVDSTKKLVFSSHVSHASHSSHSSHGSHASHGSHGSHDSHASHGSHGSHSSHGSHGSHDSHASHGSHGSHASHGSHGSHDSHASHGSHSSHGSHASHASHSNCCCGTTGYSYVST